MYEYKIEHYGAIEPNFEAIKGIVGVEVFESEHFLISAESSSSVIVAISRADDSRIAFAKTIDYMLTISDSIVVHDL